MVVLLVCLGAALNLALWAVLYRTLDALPSRIASLIHRERSQAAAQAQAALQEAAAAKVAPLLSGLRAYQDQVEQNFRGQVAEAETRARVAERRAAEAAPLLGAASSLAQEIRRTLEDFRSALEGLGPLAALFSELRAANEALCADEAVFAPATATPAPESGARETVAHAMRETVTAGPDSDDARRSLGTLPPEGGASTPASPGEEDSGDQLTVVATRPAIRPPPRLDDAGLGERLIGTPGDQPEETAS